MMSKDLLSKCMNRLIKDNLQECGWSIDEVKVSVRKVSTEAANVFESFLFMKLIENPSVSVSDGYIYFNMNEVKEKMKISQDEFSILMRMLASISLTIIKIGGIEFSISNVFPEYKEIPGYPDEEESTYGYRLFVNNGFKRACLEIAEQEHINEGH